MVKIHESAYGTSPNNFHVTKHGDHLAVELTYPPRNDSENILDQVRYVSINQESVRASDGIRLSYDYERDGWVVEQPTRLSWEIGDEACNPDYKEVGFFQSWAISKDDD